MGEVDTNYRLYNALDALATRLSAETMIKEIEEKNLTKFYNDRVHPLARLVASMNRRGVWVDQKTRVEALTVVDKEIEETIFKMSEIAGREINPSGDSFREWLFEDLSLPGVKSKKTGKWLADEDIIKTLASKFPEIEPVCSMALAVRHNKTLRGTFLEPAEFVDENGRIHPAFRIGPVTGRLACKKPNLQNIPTGVCRAMYAARSGYVFIGADYSQVEMRMFAILSGCKNLIKIFEEGKDYHTHVSVLLFGPKLGPIKHFRSYAKRFNFGMIYGGSDETLQSAVSKAYSDAGQAVSPNIVQKAMTSFFLENPEARVYMNFIRNKVKTTKTLYNAFGRPRIFFGSIEEALGQGGNFPMQSGAGDLMNERMIEIDRKLDEAVLIQVHDFIMCEVKMEYKDEAAKIVKETLERPCPEFKGYSFPVDVKIGKTWNEV